MITNEWEERKMLNKIAAVGIWCSFLSLYIASYVLAGFKGLFLSLLVSAIWASIAMIIKADRDKQIESLDRYKAEVHNLRIAIVDFQRTVDLANSMLAKNGLSVKMPTIISTVLPSVFDQK